MAEGSEVAVQIDVEIADLHRGPIHEQVVYLADPSAVRSEHVPAAHIRVALSDLEVVELVERYEKRGAKTVPYDIERVVELVQLEGAGLIEAVSEESFESYERSPADRRPAGGADPASFLVRRHDLLEEPVDREVLELQHAVGRQDGARRHRSTAPRRDVGT